MQHEIAFELKDGDNTILMGGEPILFLDPARREGNHAAILRYGIDIDAVAIGDPTASTYYPDFGVLHDGDVALWALRFDAEQNDYFFLEDVGYNWYRPEIAVAKAVELCRHLYQLALEEGYPHQWDLLEHDHFEFARVVAKATNQPLKEETLHAAL